MSEDCKIVDLFYARNEQAIKELSEKYGQACLRLAENILRNRSDAEECVNDAYLALWNNIPPAKPDPLKAYLFRVVRNLSIAKFHANTAEKRNSHYDLVLDELEGVLPATVTLERELESEALAKHIDRFLDSLDKDSRVMFLCRYWRSDSLSEIAEKFGTNSHNVSVRLSRIREKLKKYLEKEGFEL